MAPDWVTSSWPTSSAAGCWSMSWTWPRSMAPIPAPTTPPWRPSSAATGPAWRSSRESSACRRPTWSTPEQADAAIEDWRDHLGEAALAVLATSAATGAGLDRLRSAIVGAVPPAQHEGASDGQAEAEHRVYRPGAGDALDVTRTGPGAFRVAGERVERLMARHDLGNDEALRYLEDRLRSMGVVRALEAAGFEPGDDVEIAGTVFELDPRR